MEAVGYKLSLLKCKEGAGENLTAGTSLDPEKKIITFFKLTSSVPPVR